MIDCYSDLCHWVLWTYTMWFHTFYFVLYWLLLLRSNALRKSPIVAQSQSLQLKASKSSNDNVRSELQLSKQIIVGLHYIAQVVYFSIKGLKSLSIASFWEIFKILAFQIFSGISELLDFHHPFSNVNWISYKTNKGWDSLRATLLVPWVWLGLFVQYSLVYGLFSLKL